MRPSLLSSAPRDANLPLIPLIIGRRSNTFVIDASYRPHQTQIKNDSHDVHTSLSLAPLGFSLARPHFLLAR